MLLRIVGSCGHGTAKNESVDVTFDASTLGARGGALCDAYRSCMTTTVVSFWTRGVAASDDSERRAIVREFFENAERSTDEMQKLAPPELKAAFGAQHKGNVLLLQALKKVDFDLRRLDADVLLSLADLDPGSSPDGNLIVPGQSARSAVTRSFGRPINAADPRTTMGRCRRRGCCSSSGMTVSAVV